MTLSNIITISRLLLVPCFFGLFYYYLYGYDNLIWLVRILLLVIVFSDFFDGYFARTRGEITNLGKFLDPIADKLFVVCSFILLSAFEIIPVWLTIIVVSKDVMVSIGWCILAFFYNKKEVKPTYFGKLSTAIQFIVICIFILIPLKFVPELTLIIITSLVTLIAMLHYIYVGIKILSEQNNL